MGGRSNRQPVIPGADPRAFTIEEFADCANPKCQKHFNQAEVERCRETGLHREKP